MNCQRVQQRQSMPVGRSSAQAEADRRHIAGCTRCTAYLRRDATVVRLLQQKYAATPGPGYEARLIRQIRRAVSDKPVPVLFTGMTVWRYAAAAVFLAVVGFEAYRRLTSPEAEGAANPVAGFSSGVEAPRHADTGDNGVERFDVFDLEQLLTFRPAPATTNRPPEPQQNDAQGAGPTLIRYDR